MLGILLGLFNLGVRGVGDYKREKTNIETKKRTNDGFTYRDSHSKEYLCSNNHQVRRKSMSDLDFELNLEKLIINKDEVYPGDEIMYDTVTHMIVRNFSAEDREWRASDEYKQKYEEWNKNRKTKWHEYTDLIYKLEKEEKRLRNGLSWQDYDNPEYKDIVDKIHELNRHRYFLEEEERDGVNKVRNSYPREFEKWTLGGMPESVPTRNPYKRR